MFSYDTKNSFGNKDLIPVLHLYPNQTKQENETNQKRTTSSQMKDSSGSAEGKHKKRSSNSLTDVYKQIISDLEFKKPNNINILNISKEYGIQHRRVYDLFNLLTSLGVCQNVERGKLAWCGIFNVPTIISKAYSKIEINSLTMSPAQLFCLGPSPSLGDIATHFISMYLFFDVDTLLLKQVSSMFHDPRADIKSLERRMYLVLSFLELLGIVAHTMKTNEYKLLLDLSQAKKAALTAKRKIIHNQYPLALENLLNNVAGPFYMDIRKERLRECPIIHC